MGNREFHFSNEAVGRLSRLIPLTLLTSIAPTCIRWTDNSPSFPVPIEDRYSVRTPLFRPLSLPCNWFSADHHSSPLTVIA